MGTAGLATASLAGPAIGQDLRARTLRFVPQANLTALDPVWTTAAVTGTTAARCSTRCIGLTDDLQVRPQMADGPPVSDDGRTWSIRLREGLKFHDGEPVLARGLRGRA